MVVSVILELSNSSRVSKDPIFTQECSTFNRCLEVTSLRCSLSWQLDAVLGSGYTLRVSQTLTLTNVLSAISMVLKVRYTDATTLPGLKSKSHRYWFSSHASSWLTNLKKLSLRFSPKLLQHLPWSRLSLLRTLTSRFICSSLNLDSLPKSRL